MQPVSADASRIQALRRLLEKDPRDTRARFGLAAEFERAEQWEDVVRELRAYLEVATDEGNAYGRLGRALRELGHEDEARAAYQAGVDAAYRHSHPTMALEFEEVLDEM